MVDDIKYLLKFGSKENMESLLYKGEIFMNTLRYFQELDQQGIGDKQEGTFEIINYLNGELSIEVPETGEILKFRNVRLSKKVTDKVGNIFSTYALTNNLLENKISHKIDERIISEFGTHCVIIKDVARFIRSIYDELKVKKIPISQSLIEYIDFREDNRNLSFFNKSNKFSYQNIHRIMAYTYLDEPLHFEIGPIYNFAEIYLTEYLIKNSIFSKGDPNYL